MQSDVYFASTKSMSHASASAVFYEAACRLSAVRNVDDPENDYEFSCHAIAATEVGDLTAWSECRDTYEKLMLPSDDPDGWLSPSDVMFAAEAVGWSEQDYRTFMLLMAAEAVK